MGRVVVFMSLTLDGVMQSPGRPDEDTRGAFEQGGWGVRYADSVSASMVRRSAGTTEGLLLGRKTYEDFFQVWPNRADNPFTEALNKAQKYVVSTTLSEPLPWVNSTLLKGGAAESVAGLKQRPEKDLGDVTAELGDFVLGWRGGGARPSDSARPRSPRHAADGWVQARRGNTRRLGPADGCAVCDGAAHPQAADP